MFLAYYMFRVIDDVVWCVATAIHDIDMCVAFSCRSCCAFVGLIHAMLFWIRFFQDMVLFSVVVNL